MNHWLNRCHFGDCRDTMRRMIADGVRVQCIVTSPPYWGLRDYGVEGQIGLEQTLPEFLAQLVEVFDLCRQLLTDDGTLWLNMGDSYASSWGAQSREHAGKHAPNVSAISANQVKAAQLRSTGTGSLSRTPGLKPKDLIGQPWRLAFALQDAGWWLRQDIIWSKPNPMPESVRDRCTKSHEYLFLMTRSERYFFDQDAILEPASPNTLARLAQDVANQTGSTRANGGGKTNGNMKAVGRGSSGVGFGHGYDANPKPRSRRDSFKREDSKREQAIPGQSVGTHRPERAESEWDVSRRNRRSVWTIPTQAYSGAHFATFPEALVEPCVLAGSRPGDIVFDPFFGTGTTGRVALRLGRQFIGCELNPANSALQDDRLRGVTTGLPLEAVNA
ncbi:DNA-methyltransferase [Methyloversatilis sp.]|uniref:DNA-methyltransferase n=1 Tax=Methyloversatilis sp. TaxID=2569862 RepID=UPI003D2C734C